MRVLAIDLGRQMGFGLLGGAKVRSGSREVVKRWTPYGPSFLALRAVLQNLIDIHKPDCLACARPFVRLDRTEDDQARKYNDTTQNLVPMFGGFVVLHMVGAENNLRVEVIEESDARSIMLGQFLPAGSEAIKKAVHQACKDRGWACCDWNASDALCIGSAVLERLEPADAHQTTPLFIAAAANPRPRKRKRRAA